MRTPPLPMAIAGAACISSSAVVMDLAGSSASVTALGRCLFALPVLGVLVVFDRRRGTAPLTVRSRWLARLSGVFLAGDLVLWSHSITAIGAGLVLVGGLTGGHVYGAHPALGVAEGVGVAVLYSLYIMMLRQTTLRPAAAGPAASVVGALFEATLGGAVASAVLGLALRDYRLGPAWPALGWLVLLALTSQVIGWLLITVSMPRLPAWVISVVLLIQPAGSVTLGYLVLGERPSLIQLAGVALMLAGVLVAVSGGTAAGPAPAQHQDHPPRAGGVEAEVVVEVAVAGGDPEVTG
jgi:drug/metabolite transporter (DMT)-like permease